MRTPRGSSIGMTLVLLFMMVINSSPLRVIEVLPYVLTLGFYGISRGVRELAQTPLAIQKKQREIMVVIVVKHVKYGISTGEYANKDIEKQPCS